MTPQTRVRRGTLKECMLEHTDILTISLIKDITSLTSIGFVTAACLGRPASTPHRKLPHLRGATADIHTVEHSSRPCKRGDHPHRFVGNRGLGLLGACANVGGGQATGVLHQHKEFGLRPVVREGVIRGVAFRQLGLRVAK